MKLHLIPVTQRLGLLCFVGIECILLPTAVRFCDRLGNGARCTGQNAACSDLVNKALCQRWEIDFADTVVKAGRMWGEFSL